MINRGCWINYIFYTEEVIVNTGSFKSSDDLKLPVLAPRGLTQ